MFTRETRTSKPYFKLLNTEFQYIAFYDQFMALVNKHPENRYFRRINETYNISLAFGQQ